MSRAEETKHAQALAFASSALDNNVHVEKVADEISARWGIRIGDAQEIVDIALRRVRAPKLTPPRQKIIARKDVVMSTAKKKKKSGAQLEREIAAALSPSPFGKPYKTQAEQIDEIATIYRTLLRDEVGDTVLGQIDKANRAERNRRILHDYDHTDANVLMATAFERVVGRPVNVKAEVDVNTWNAAWDTIVERVGRRA
jgi:hypothetical protein